MTDSNLVVRQQQPEDAVLALKQTQKCFALHYKSWITIRALAEARWIPMGSIKALQAIQMSHAEIKL